MLKSGIPQFLKFSLWVALLSTAAKATAQMSGAYTIDTTVTASSTNFKNWYSFWRSLQGLNRNDGGPKQSGGVSGAVNVTVKNTQYLPDSAPIQFPAVSGIGTGKRITIDGNGKSVIFRYLYDAVLFSGGDYITIKNLTITNTANTFSQTCIRFSNNSDYNTIENCTLEFTNLTNTQLKPGSAYVAFAHSGFLTTATNTQTGSYDTIRNNLMRTTNSGSPGPVFGICLTSGKSSYTSNPNNITLEGNIIQNFLHRGIYGKYNNGLHIIKNDISRANCSNVNNATVLSGIEIDSSAGSNRSLVINHNKIHDLPFLNCPTTSGLTSFSALNVLTYAGNSPAYVQDNRISRIVATSNAMGIQVAYAEKTVIERDTLENFIMAQSGIITSLTGIYSGKNTILKKNLYRNNYSANSGGGSTSFVVVSQVQDTGYNEFEGNTISNNETYGDLNLTNLQDGHWKVNRNTLANNTITGGNGGYLYGLIVQEFENLQMNNNLIYGNLGHDGVLPLMAASKQSGNFRADVHQNTIYCDGQNAPTYGWGYDMTGLYVYPYNHQEVYCSGNIVELLNSDYAEPAIADAASAGTWKLWDNNTYHIQNISQETWYCTLGAVSDFAAWQALGFGGAGENNINPDFVNAGKGDFHPQEWLVMNNTGTQKSNPADLALKTRNANKSDRGVYEVFSDLKAETTSVNIGSAMCMGKSIVADLTIKNLFADTVHSFFIAWNIDGNSPYRQKVTRRIKPGDTARIWLQKPIVFNSPGKHTVHIYIDIPDDNRANDSFHFITTVLPSPGGGSYTNSSKSTAAIYRNGNPYDVTFVGEPAIYTFSSPRVFTNADYGTKWTASIWSVTTGGRTRPSTET
ncbi:MAG: hypothetical protein JNL57_08765, partial [Bacteroidetes bacterium]|nr:hypothetical protein [Bacteroidota bacterium]